MILCNTENIPGMRVTRTLGMVKGSTVRAKHMGRDFFAGLKAMVGGEIGAYTEMLVESRDQAEARMIQEAERLGANAVVNIRYTTSAVMQGAAEILAYGTAVVVDEA